MFLDCLVLFRTHVICIIVNVKIFARVLSLQNFAYVFAKFCENKTISLCHLPMYSKICLKQPLQKKTKNDYHLMQVTNMSLNVIHKIKFSQKILNLL